VRVLGAPDVAARSLDIVQLPAVVNTAAIATWKAPLANHHGRGTS
jgi:hypothetical protein